jgi:molybdate transport system substrate-binding protein
MAGENVRRLAIGDPDLVPAGGYARQALRTLGLWDRVRPRVVTAPDVRAALTYVESGEADLGIVYRTDTLLTPRVKVVMEIPADAHEPIRYPVARVAHPGASTAVGSFLEFLRGDEVRPLLVEAGFTPVFP